MSSSNPRLSHPKYRPDIDGLRALAVLSVVLYHAFPSRLKGGFVGVDVFFVISGYLISTIIFTNLESGTFSFSEFYVRRVKRIFPALLVVLFSSFLFGWFALLADEFEQLGKHILAGAGFVSNLILWTESGYFDNVAESKPLLHLWSLGIEEQFYIVWPLLVWFAWRSKLGLFLLTLAVFSVSFFLNIYGIGEDSVATFYSPMTRFWELSVGSLLAYLTLHKHINASSFTVIQSNIISTIGFALVVFAVVITNKRHAFPGWWAVLPVLGSALVIADGNKSWINTHVFSNKIAVWFGLISFPLYLWHWPLLSFGRLVEGQAPDRMFRVAAVIVSVLLAWITYRFVERYIRFSKGNRFARHLIGASIVVALMGAYVLLTDGIESRGAVRNSGLTREVIHQFMRGSLWPYAKNDTCLNEYPYKDAEKLSWWFCMKSDVRKPTLVILGNSYANQLYPGFAKNPAFEHHTILSIGTCEFAITKDSFKLNPKHPCYGSRAREQGEFIDGLVINEPAIRFVVIGGMPEDADNEYIEALRKRITLYESRGIEVVMFYPHLNNGNPADYHPRACFSRPLRRQAKDCSFSIDRRIELDKKFSSIVDAITQSNPNVKFFDQNDIFCANDKCSFVRGGMPLLRDEYSHISEYASVELQYYFNEWAKVSLPQIFDSGLVKH